MTAVPGATVPAAAVPGVTAVRVAVPGAAVPGAAVPAALAAPGRATGAHGPPAAVPLAPPPVCATDDGHDFPVTTRITGGPDSYVAGDDPATWYLDLTNTTSRACSGIHPVVVLVDDEQSLALAQPRMDFSDGTRTHSVSFEESDLHELIGVFADDEAGFPGFTVGAGRTLRVAVNLAFADGTEDHQVTADAAVVQRRDDDGEWVGQSGNYRFRVIGDADEAGEEGRDGSGAASEDGDQGAGQGGDPGAGTGAGTEGGSGGGIGGRTDDGGGTDGWRAGSGGNGSGEAGSGEAGSAEAGELARTGAAPASPVTRRAAVASALCLLLGTVLVVLAHRVRRPRKAGSAP